MPKRSKMKYDISFQEMARLGRELLLKQPPITLQEAREQAERVQKRIANKVKKTALNTDKKNNKFEGLPLKQKAYSPKA